ncbi:MAG: hypothetical protein JWQ69_5442 [Pseudomonas sp.]|nr:hypothetical protein [Pseudomonas sp.]
MRYPTHDASTANVGCQFVSRIWCGSEFIREDVSTFNIIGA